MSVRPDTPEGLKPKYLLEHFDTKMVSANFFDQLTLLTLGPQLRGGANVQKGTSVISDVFDVVFQIVRALSVPIPVVSN